MRTETARSPSPKGVRASRSSLATGVAVSEVGTGEAETEEMNLQEAQDLRAMIPSQLHPGASPLLLFWIGHGCLGGGG